MGEAILQGCRRYSYLCLAGIMGRRAAGKRGNWGCCARDRAHRQWAKKPPAVPSTAPVLGREPKDCDRKGNARPACAELCRGAGGERRQPAQRGNGEVLAWARCAGESQPAHRLPRSAASWLGPQGGTSYTFFGGEIKPSNLC